MILWYAFGYAVLGLGIYGAMDATEAVKTDWQLILFWPVVILLGVAASIFGAVRWVVRKVRGFTNGR